MEATITLTRKELAVLSALIVTVVETHGVPTHDGVRLALTSVAKKVLAAGESLDAEVAAAN